MNVYKFRSYNLPPNCCSHLLQILYDYRDDLSNSCTLSYKHIAKLLDCTTRTIIRKLKILELNELITKKRGQQSLINITVNVENIFTSAKK